VDERFEQVDARFEQVDARFEQVDDRFRQLEQLILAEGEKTRRHFDVAVEQMKAERNLWLDKAMATDQQLLRLLASNATDHVRFETQLNDHERRLLALEGQEPPTHTPAHPETG
jgi:hypothetical protein